MQGNDDLDTLDLRQVLIPDINFTCNGTITRWIIGARWLGQSSAHTELQIWRKVSENVYTKVTGTPLMVGTENRSEVYEYTLGTPLAFKEGDILGYFQPIRNRSEIILQLEDSDRLTTYYTGLGVNDLDPPVSGATFSLNTARVDTRYPVIAVRTGKMFYYTRSTINARVLIVSLHICLPYTSMALYNKSYGGCCRSPKLCMWFHVSGEGVCIA